ncbi:MAG: peptide chain release factor N(5)-glutamine methyltransferase [Roseitalea sp.]|jgi:release factor glutamine methyltransferase|nr:peptide chain release factor N(5)-glutamine methyltransferase [Roseitalea sp.]MBO6722590.1 peptide chain release factor N(5)-glutamine methyltransferase [Roseitalea sp.]MBO6745121.1 peptide chain release factor N(5)-glutamine methyltransferase [Roseitalea sp.]
MTGSASLQDAYDDAVAHLSRAGSPTPDLDATLLVEHTTGMTALDRLTQPDKPLNPRQHQALRTAIARRMSHEPVHRIIGWREFYGLPLSLNAHTLVPRPDTETLVDLVLPFAHHRAEETGICRVLDLGTGSGAIALAILNEVRQAEATGTDVSIEALEMATRNAQGLGLSDRFTALRSDWFSALSGQFDLIVSNPPYIPTAVIPTLDPDVRDHDPLAALDGGSDGLNAYGLIAGRGLPHLADKGRIAVEIGKGQRSAVASLFAAAGLQVAASAQDLNGLERAIMFSC